MASTPDCPAYGLLILTVHAGDDVADGKVARPGPRDIHAVRSNAIRNRR